MDQRPPPDVNENPLSARVSGHFGELVQGCLGNAGPVVLVTLPCPPLETEVRLVPGGPLKVAGEQTELVAKLARNALASWGADEAGTLEISRPASPGTGAGSSTAELLATLRVLAASQGKKLSPDQEAAWCHGVEGAVDPLMYPGNVLFASRIPRVLEILPPLPSFKVIGGFAGPGQRTNPADSAFPDVTDALELLRAGLSAGDACRVAEAAHMSAKANQARNPNPAWDAVLALGKRFGALGPLVSHTGSAIGLIFDADADTAPVSEAVSAIGLTGVISFQV